MAQEEPEEPMVQLMFADGTQHSVGAGDAAAVLRGYAVRITIFRSRRVFDLFAEYVDKHAAYRRGDDADPADIDDLDHRFIAQVDDTDTLHDLLLAWMELGEYELMDLCALDDGGHDQGRHRGGGQDPARHRGDHAGAGRPGAARPRPPPPHQPLAA